MNKILEECKKYDLIGVGELTHGELTSWKYRYKIVKYLIKHFNQVIIFCETLIHIFLILIIKILNLIFTIVKINIMNFIHQ